MAIERLAVNKEKYFISPSGQIHYAKPGENHPDLARRIMDEYPYLRDIFDEELDEVPFNFLISYGFISVDAVEGHEEVIYSSKSLGRNKRDLDMLDFFKYDVYEYEIQKDKAKLNRLNEILEERTNVEEASNQMHKKEEQQK